MIFEPLTVAGAFKIVPERKEDNRGFFARVFCPQELGQQGLEPNFLQQSISFNLKAGTFRGMHFQKAPKEEVKIVRCTMGSAIDIVLDLRKESPTYLKLDIVEITAENKIAVYIPKGCAHGFLTLTDNTELLYNISVYFEPSLSAGVRWNDPKFGIKLPKSISVISPRDLEYPDYE